MAVPKRKDRKEEAVLADNGEFGLKGSQSGSGHRQTSPGHPSVSHWQYYSQSSVMRGSALVSFIICTYMLIHEWCEETGADQRRDGVQVSQVDPGTN
jgi:hypothetical protein